MILRKREGYHSRRYQKRGYAAIDGKGRDYTKNYKRLLRSARNDVLFSSLRGALPEKGDEAISRGNMDGWTVREAVQ